MFGDHIERSEERAWKHRFAQTLYEVFCQGGLDRAAALDDAYAHADAQYLVRGLKGPEEEARAALSWIRAHEVATQVRHPDEPAAANNPHNGASHHVEAFTIIPTKPRIDS